MTAAKARAKVVIVRTTGANTVNMQGADWAVLDAAEKVQARACRSPLRNGGVNVHHLDAEAVLIELERRRWRIDVTL